MTSAGLRIGALSKPKIKDLEPRTINGYDTYKITVDGDDRNAKYWTTCTNELEWRSQNISSNVREKVKVLSMGIVH
jgi:hypothetical protein